MTLCRLDLISPSLSEYDQQMKAEIDLKQITPDWLEIIANQVESLKFGVVQITVHESRVVQIEKTEKVRFDKSEKRDTR